MKCNHFVCEPAFTFGLRAVLEGNKKSFENQLRLHFTGWLSRLYSLSGFKDIKFGLT